MYSEKIIEVFDEHMIEMGDRVKVYRKGKIYEGLVMPRTGESDVLVIKLDNGYNVGFKIDDIEIEKSKTETPKNIEEQVSVNTGKYHKHLEIEESEDKPTISILSSGGTIASKIDYRTGGVKPTFTADEIITMIPEIAGMANVKGRLIQNIFSEDMLFSDYTNIAEEIEKEIKKGVDGIIITHGTDTLHYTAAALSFAFEECPVPILLVGSQRSSDRGSSDGPYNLLCAANFIVNSDFAGVATCMHASSSDNGCLIIDGTRSRKLHTSRRDAFKPVNDFSIALAGPKNIEFYTTDYRKRGGDLSLKEEFETDVALVKMHPGIDPDGLYDMIKDKKGIVIEGTGLGHVPEAVMKTLEKYSKKGIIVMASQCIYGRVNLNVYSRGRDLLEMGVIPAEDMTAETALVKLSWLLGNHPSDAKDLMPENLRGEISDRSII